MPPDALPVERVELEDSAAWIARLGDLAQEDARREFFSSVPQAHHLATAEQLHTEVLRLAYVDLKRAERLAEATEWLADVLHNPAARAFSLRSRGHVFFAQGQHSKALESYEAAIRLQETLGLELDIGRTLTSGLQALIYLGRYDQAFQWAERARGIFERHGDQLRLARLASNMGNILYRQDRHADALAYYEKAREPLGRLGEPRDLAAVLSNMAVCCTSLGRFADAVGHYEAARDHCVRHGLPLLVAAADYNIAYLHYLRGDYIRAMQLYRVSRAHAEQASDFYHAALCDLDESEMCLELNLTDEGAQLAKQAAVRFEQFGMNYERAKAVVNQAMAASHASDLGRALQLLRQARRLFEHEQNQVWPAIIDLYQAILRYQQGRYPEAQRLSRRAARFLSSSLMLGKAALCELLQAQLLWKEGHADQARLACRSILLNLDPDVAPSLRFHVNFVLGQVEEQLENWDGAWNAYQAARQEIENLRSRLWGDELKISILKDKLAVYEALVWLLLWRKPSEESAIQEAFLLVCQAKSRSLADQIAFPLLAPPRNSGGVEARIQELRRDLNWYYRQMEVAALLARSGLPEQMEGLRQQAREHENLLVRTLGELRATAPGPAVEDIPAPLSLDTIRGSIPVDAVLLEYYEIRGVLYVCLVSRERLRILPLVPAAQVRELLRLLQFQLSKFRLGPQYQQAFREPMLSASLSHLEKLYGELIGPIRPYLNARHLIIAPHSFLHNLPFHALRVGDRFLLDEFSISYAPSASVYSLCCTRESNFRNESLVMGIPDAVAPYIESEARFAASTLPNARLRLGPDASGAALREYGPSSRFIHIATHGLFRRDNPMFSSIRLGDSDLSLFDLYQLPLSAELVTLSGCSTGLNVVVGGDELVGLMRGLLFAGAQGILVSLWDVHDRSTAQFMTAFYRNLQHEENKAEALRTAMLELREQYAHPYYWAPFILVGKYDG
jgi:tetratricopeptide (TPR) repeat protein